MVSAVTEWNQSAVNQVIDWSLAASTGAFLARGGPSVSRAEAERAVTELRELAVDAERHVRALTRLGAELPLLPAGVFDRPDWVRAAASGLDQLTRRALTEGRSGPLAPLVAGSAGMQTGVVLAYLGKRVLGQYDPFGGPDHKGNLLLVAPNIVTAQRAIRVPATDFRMWVCLHECTHRLQFTAVDWLRDYFAGEVGKIIGGFAETESLTDVVSGLPERLNQARRAKQDGSLGLVELLQSPQQRAGFDRLLALSTLLEGHADYVMDAVGPDVVPSVATIRRRFTARRAGGGLLDRFLRSLFGIDAKVQQYKLGSAFTRHVVAAVGMEGFNAVWTSPDSLPSRSEIKEPEAWLRRMH